MTDETKGNEVRWEEPPEVAFRSSKSGKWRAIADQLRARPGQWACVYEGNGHSSASFATQLRQGKYGGWTSGEFELSVRGTTSADAGKIYARYIGGAR